MSGEVQGRGYVVRTGDLPEAYPTHKHDPEFWEALGRTVGTYGFLEDVLGRAIFAFTGTQTYPDDKIEAALNEWLLQLRKCLSDPLGGLIDSYAKAVKEKDSATIDNFDDLVADLRKASKLRNALCHGFWQCPNEEGKSIPRFFTRNGEVFDTAIDIAFLAQTRQHVAELAIFVVNSVTCMGWQFPGSGGPGEPIAA